MYLILSSALHDPHHFEKPDAFYPGHFLDTQGNFRKLEVFIPFSMGKPCFFSPKGMPVHSHSVCDFLTQFRPKHVSAKDEILKDRESKTSTETRIVGAVRRRGKEGMRYDEGERWRLSDRDKVRDTDTYLNTQK